MLINNLYRWIKKMSKQKSKQCLILCLLSMLSINCFAQATVETLQAEKKLHIKVNLIESTNLVPNQPVTLEIEVVSAYPFADNFTLSYVDIADTVIIQADDKTQLDAKEIKGEQWFTQRKNVVVYPLKGGTYNVPVISAQVFINVDNKGNVSGQLETQKMQFNVTAPSVLKNQENYISSPNVTIKLTKDSLSKVSESKKSGSEETEAALNVGSAVTFSYQIKAENMHVIMLPKLELPTIDGLQVYHKPAIEKNEFDRFEKTNTASLTEKYTFIFQKEGTFIIPEKRIIWWNTVTKELKEEVFEQQTLIVGDGAVNAGSDNSSNQPDSSFSKLNAMNGLYIVVLLLFLSSILWQVMTHKKALIAYFHQINQTQQKHIVKEFTGAIANQNYQSAVLCLYQLTNITSISALSNLVSGEDLQRLNRLQNLAFNQLDSTQEFTTKEGQLLLAGFLKKHSKSARSKAFKFSYKLNPEK